MLNIFVYLKICDSNGFLYLVRYNEPGIVHCAYQGVASYNFPNYDVLQSLKIVLILENNASLMKWHFIWVFTVCQSTR